MRRLLERLWDRLAFSEPARRVVECDGPMFCRLLADARARQEGKNLSGSERRETRAVDLDEAAERHRRAGLTGTAVDAHGLLREPHDGGPHGRDLGLPI